MSNVAPAEMERMRRHAEAQRQVLLAPGSCSEPRLIERWTFPLGAKMATLTITATEGSKVNPEDIDALFEITLLFKQQIMRRHREHPSPQSDYEI